MNSSLLTGGGLVWWKDLCDGRNDLQTMPEKAYLQLHSRFLQKAVYSSFHLYFCTNQQEISSCRMTWHVCGRISQKQVLLSQSPRPFYSCEVDDGRNSFSFIFSLFLVVLVQARRILYLLWFYQYGENSLSFIINFSLYAKIFLENCSHLSFSISFLGGFWMGW